MGGGHSRNVRPYVLKIIDLDLDCIHAQSGSGLNVVTILLKAPFPLKK